MNRDLLSEAVDDLVNRVEDWKKHRVDHFGDLLMHGVYTVVTGKGDQEKDVSFPLPCDPHFTRCLLTPFSQV